MCVLWWTYDGGGSPPPCRINQLLLLFMSLSAASSCFCWSVPRSLPVPCDHRVGRSRGDASEGDRFLVVSCGVEGLLGHGQDGRDCRDKDRGERVRPGGEGTCRQRTEDCKNVCCSFLQLTHTLLTGKSLCPKVTEHSAPACPCHPAGWSPSACLRGDSRLAALWDKHVYQVS